jgi:hypothetical protein
MAPDCSCPPYVYYPPATTSENDKTIPTVLRTFFFSLSRAGKSLHEALCITWFSRTVSQTAIEKALHTIENKKLCDNTDALTFPLHPLDIKYFQEEKQTQRTFWRDRLVWRGLQETVALYTLALPLSMAEVIDLLEPIHITIAPPRKRIIPAPEPPGKRSRGPNKCGFCREPGHTVRGCTERGIDDFREQTKAARRRKLDANFARARQPWPPPPAPAPVTSYNFVRGGPPSRSAAPAVSAEEWIPSGQVRFSIDCLAQLMAKPLVDRIKEGTVLKDAELTKIWKTLSVKLDLISANVKEDDIEITGMHVNYPTCPLSGLELRWPVVGDNCTHKTTQFFDLPSLISFWTQCGRSNRHTNNWNKCKICKAELTPALLHRNSAFEAELAKLKKQNTEDEPDVVEID